MIISVISSMAKIGRSIGDESRAGSSRESTSIMIRILRVGAIRAAGKEMNQKPG
jgi:hypothetical protein